MSYERILEHSVLGRKPRRNYRFRALNEAEKFNQPLSEVFNPGEQHYYSAASVAAGYAEGVTGVGLHGVDIVVFPYNPNAPLTARNHDGGVGAYGLLVKLCAEGDILRLELVL